MKGQLTALQVAADQQGVPRRGGPDPRPGVPAVAPGSPPGGADLPAAGVLGQRRDSVFAGQDGAVAEGDAEVLRHPQHVRLLLLFQPVPQLRAVPVYLVPAHEIENHPVSKGFPQDLDRQLPLGEELQADLPGYGSAAPDTLQRRFLNSGGIITTHNDQITRPTEPAHLLTSAPPGHPAPTITVPWWGGRTLRYEYA